MLKYHYLCLHRVATPASSKLHYRLRKTMNASTHTKCFNQRVPVNRVCNLTQSRSTSSCLFFRTLHTDQRHRTFHFLHRPDTYGMKRFTGLCNNLTSVHYDKEWEERCVFLQHPVTRCRSQPRALLTGAEGERFVPRPHRRLHL